MAWTVWGVLEQPAVSPRRNHTDLAFGERKKKKKGWRHPNWLKLRGKTEQEFVLWITVMSCLCRVCVRLSRDLGWRDLLHLGLQSLQTVIFTPHKLIKRTKAFIMFQMFPNWSKATWRLKPRMLPCWITTAGKIWRSGEHSNVGNFLETFLQC